jgi:hypothetical protein
VVCGGGGDASLRVMCDSKQVPGWGHVCRGGVTGRRREGRRTRSFSAFRMMTDEALIIISRTFDRTAANAENHTTAPG